MTPWTLAIGNLATVTSNTLTETCPVCGAMFAPAHKKSYCSPACRHIAYAPKKAAMKKAIRTNRPPAPVMMMPAVRVCAICGEPLPDKMRKYCGPKCEAVVRNAYKRAYRAAR